MQIRQGKVKKEGKFLKFLKSILLQMTDALLILRHIILGSSLHGFFNVHVKHDIVIPPVLLHFIC